jgi:hypothetical protein
MHLNKRCRRSLTRPNRTTPKYHDVDHGVAVGWPRRFCVVAPIAFVGGMGGWCCGALNSLCNQIVSMMWVRDGIVRMYSHTIEYISTYKFQKFGKCQLEPTQTATTSKILCRRHGPIWPKLERHVVSSPTCRDMLATSPAKKKRRPNRQYRKKSSVKKSCWYREFLRPGMTHDLTHELSASDRFGEFQSISECHYRR